MTKEDKLQLVKWIILCALSFLLCAYGFILRLNGYGKTGAIMKDLNKVIKEYNSLSLIENNIADIKATYKNKSIIVSYITERVDIEYEFKYEKVEDLKTIKMTYKEGDSARAEDVVKAMIEAVSITAGNEEGKVFSQYKYKNFYQTELKDGILIKANGGFITVQIVLNTNMLDNIKDKFFDEALTTHISMEDLTELTKDLANNEKFLLLKGNVMIYVVETEKEYQIFSSDKEENKKNIYESIMSVLSIIDVDVYNDVIDAKIDLTEESIRQTYKSEINPETITYNQQMNDDFVVKVTVNKKPN